MLGLFSRSNIVSRRDSPSSPANISGPNLVRKRRLYPAIFSGADVTVITKSDLLPHVPFDLDAVKDYVSSLRPSGVIHVVSSTTGEGIDEWCKLLLGRLEAKRQS